MIELLMVIMLVAILGAVALPQFLDFRREGKIAAINQITQSVNTGVKLQYMQSILKCNNTSKAFAPVDSLAANDITAGSSPLCTTSQIPVASERRFIDQAGFPANPRNNLTNVGPNGCSPTTHGWCYSNTSGLFYTASSKTDTCAGGVGTSSQTCNDGEDCTLVCAGCNCTQNCQSGATSCNLICAGGSCSQTCGSGVSCLQIGP